MKYIHKVGDWMVASAPEAVKGKLGSMYDKAKDAGKKAMTSLRTRAETLMKELKSFFEGKWKIISAVLGILGAVGIGIGVMSQCSVAKALQGTSWEKVVG